MAWRRRINDGGEDDGEMAAINKRAKIGNEAWRKYSSRSETAESWRKKRRQSIRRIINA